MAEALEVNKTLTSVDLDGHALEIKKLRGEEPVESIDLSGKRLTFLSAVVIASLIPSNTATKSLSLDNNEICGLNMLGGTYTAEGITAITEMLKVNTTLQSIRCASCARFLANCQQPLTH